MEIVARDYRSMFFIYMLLFFFNEMAGFEELNFRLGEFFSNRYFSHRTFIGIAPSLARKIRKWYATNICTHSWQFSGISFIKFRTTDICKIIFSKKKINIAVRCNRERIVSFLFLINILYIYPIWIVNGDSNGDRFHHRFQEAVENAADINNSSTISLFSNCVPLRRLDAHAIKHSYTYRKRDGADPGKMLLLSAFDNGGNKCTQTRKNEKKEASSRFERSVLDWSDFSSKLVFHRLYEWSYRLIIIFPYECILPPLFFLMDEKWKVVD